MKRIALLLAAILAAAPVVRADEGMWMLPDLQKTVYKDMKKLGLKLKADEIYSVDKPSVKDAVVLFGGGCTGEVISDRGLVVTNHHCGYSHIQRLSSPEHNYLEDGYWASDLSEEIPAPGLYVQFLKEMIEVTGKTQDEIREIQNRIRENGNNLSVREESFYDGNQSYLIVTEIYNDIRFVGAPPASAGKFGGETDNWMWPRHTCDFSMFRIYADADGNPAKYSEDNVPLKTPNHLSISLAGFKEGDFAMIMGYPGSTQRYMTSAQLQDMIDVQDMLIDVRTARQDAMMKWMEQNDTIRLMYANTYASSANYWKKWQGMRECFDNLNVILRQSVREMEMGKWASAKPKKRYQYITACHTLNDYAEGSAEYNRRIRLMNESLNRIVYPGSNRTGYRKEVERDIAEAMINIYAKYASPKDSLDLSWVNVDSLYFGQNSAELANEMRGQISAAQRRVYSDGPQMPYSDVDSAQRLYTKGQLEWHRKRKTYPDANMTCRLTYGTVQGYTTKAGVKMDYYTNLAGVMAKEDPTNYEFRVPALQKELFQKKDFGQYAGPDGDIPVCFLTNLDITGGNSGSPVMDAHGNLIGLAFDGNWEAMSGDVIF